MSNERTCIQCKKKLPENTDNFHRSKDGFHARCKVCRRKHERERREKRRNHKLTEIEKGAIDLFVTSARIGGANIPHSSELLEVMMEYFGGVRGFANAYMKQFYDAPTGGAFRTKMLDTVVRLVSANTAMGGAKKPLTLWSEDELEEELQQRLMEAAFTINATDVRKLPALAKGIPGPGGVPQVSADDTAKQRADGVPSDRSQN
jgi:hypothetical protein